MKAENALPDIQPPAPDPNAPPDIQQPQPQTARLEHRPMAGKVKCSF
jgi:hypothetical protein